MVATLLFVRQSRHISICYNCVCSVLMHYQITIALYYHVILVIVIYLWLMHYQITIALHYHVILVMVIYVVNALSDNNSIVLSCYTSYGDLAMFCLMSHRCKNGRRMNHFHLCLSACVCMHTSIWMLYQYDTALKTKLNSDILHISILDKFSVDLSVTFMTLETRSQSLWLISTIEP